MTCRAVLIVDEDYSCHFDRQPEATIVKLNK